MSDTDKRRIAAAFSGASHRYEQAAAVQRVVAQRLAGRVLADAPSPADIVEIGCGTGLLTKTLLRGIPGGRWLVTDLSSEMVEYCQSSIADPRVRFRRMDGETPDLPPGSCDLLVSSLAFQWFADLPDALDRLSRCLKPGGRLMFATLGVDTFAEWRAAHAALGLPCGARPFPDAATLDGAWPTSGVGTVTEERLVTSYGDAREFLKAVKDIGAGVPAPGHRPLPASAFRRVLEVFAGGCDATYHILYGSYRRMER